MLIEGTLRWEVTEDCPWDLLLALGLRDLAGLDAVCEEDVPRGIPDIGRISTSGIDMAQLEAQWRGWWAGLIRRETRPFISQVRPPHFAVFDRALELQELVYRGYDRAMGWAKLRRFEYLRAVERRHHPLEDVYRMVQQRQFELRRQSSSFRLDLTVLPVARTGAWVVAPDTVVVSESLRDDASAFRDWLHPVVIALV
ncbi:hypothetical protein SAMN04489806_3296 [Paramicrobacterium humi]|jgi:hypothetical protein|uniref:Uncharacterized protein n=1 Tax=Paramicrobacterium humi TaxID=640635 RepID=A0A1H4TSF9_9MICO|nr:hypothetical protein [Microbacterium humi]SEC59148.1 hypothetical protein SAMN04489806_3296 [Microbacterium humi]